MPKKPLLALLSHRQLQLLERENGTRSSPQRGSKASRREPTRKSIWYPLHHALPLYGYPRHFSWRPVPSHVLRPKFMHLIVEVLPQHLAKCVQNGLHLFHAQLFLSTSTLTEIFFEFVESVVDLFVLSEQFELFLEGWHLAGEHREDVALLDGMMDGQVVAEVVSYTNELADRHATRSLFAFACAVQQLPRPAEVLML
jgi:hypothetical protein